MVGAVTAVGVGGGEGPGEHPGGQVVSRLVFLFSSFLFFCFFLLF